MKVQLIYLIFFMVGVITAIGLASFIVKAHAQADNEEDDEITDKINKQADEEADKKCMTVKVP